MILTYWSTKVSNTDDWLYACHESAVKSAKKSTCEKKPIIHFIVQIEILINKMISWLNSVPISSLLNLCKLNSCFKHLHFTRNDGIHVLPAYEIILRYSNIVTWSTFLVGEVWVFITETKTRCQKNTDRLKYFKWL